MIKKPLWEETRDLHHACEQHVVGQSMASGNPSVIIYAAWLRALHQIHSKIDHHMHESLGRIEKLQNDIVDINIEIPILNSALKYVSSLNDEKNIAGAAYVLSGAHLMGGEIMKRKLVGYPTKHLEWDDRKEAISILQQYRIRDDITTESRNCFKALLEIMDEIQTLYGDSYK